MVLNSPQLLQRPAQRSSWAPQARQRYFGDPLATSRTLLVATDAQHGPHLRDTPHAKGGKTRHWAG